MSGRNKYTILSCSKRCLLRRYHDAHQHQKWVRGWSSDTLHTVDFDTELVPGHKWGRENRGVLVKKIGKRFREAGRTPLPPTPPSHPSNFSGSIPRGVLRRSFLKGCGKWNYYCIKRELACYVFNHLFRRTLQCQ